MKDVQSILDPCRQVVPAVLEYFIDGRSFDFAQERVGKVALGVQVNHQHPHSDLREDASQSGHGGGLSDPALVVGHGYYSCLVLSI